MAADEWEVMRIFIPDDPEQLSRLVTRDYDLIEIEDLQRQLEQEVQRRQATLLDDPQLQEAIYVARQENDTLVSDTSRWTFDGTTRKAALNLGQVSLALRRSRNATPDQNQLLDHQLITPEGELELNLKGDTEARWFGFSLRAEERNFRIQVPVATSARMLVATENDTLLQSQEVVIEAISDPSALLPEDWPTLNSFGFSGSLGRQWWLVYLSGVGDFSLQAIERGAAREQDQFQQVIRSSEIDFAVGERSVDVRATFAIPERRAASQQSQIAKLRLAQTLRISSVTIAGAPLSWKTVDSEQAATQLIEVQLPSDIANAQLRVEAAGDFDSANANLPSIEMVNAFAISGRTRVFAKKDWVLSQVLATNAKVASQSVADATTFSDPVASNHWVSSWQGKPPALKAFVSRQWLQWKVRALTQLAIQSDWLSANCRMRIESDRVDSNSLRLTVADGWFVDSVRLINPDGSDLRAEFLERGTDQDPVTDVVLSWERKRPQLAIELDLTAHQPLRNSNRIRLRPERLLQVPGADQIDHFVIEPSASYRVDASAELLTHLRQPTELPAWQQQLLPQLTERWILGGSTRQLPSVNLLASRGTYAADIVTLVQSDVQRSGINPLGLAPHAASSSSSNGSFSKVYRADCFLKFQPISGSLESMQIVMPSGVDLDALVWNEVSEGGSIVRNVMAERRTDENGQEQLWLDLLDPQAAAITLHTFYPLTMQTDSQGRNTFPIAVPGVPNAVAGESLLMLPGELSNLRSRLPAAGASPDGNAPDGNQLGTASIEMLPATACCDDRSLLAYVDGQDQSVLNGLVAARLDLEQPHALESEFVTRTQRGWVWNERIEHWMDGNERRFHLARWKVQASQSGSFAVTLPVGWWVESVRVNGLEVNQGIPVGGTKLAIDLPADRVSEVEMHCLSPIRPATWLSRETIESPTIELEVYASTHELHVPPSKVPLALIPMKRVSNTLMDRLSPAAWWNWLSPKFRDENVLNQEHPGWITLQVSGERPRVAPDTLVAPAAFWVVDRSAVAAIALAVVLAATIGFWMLFGKSLRFTWLVLGGLVCGLVLVPSAWVGVWQILLLAALMAVLLRMALVVFERQFQERGRGGSRVLRRSVTTVGLMLWCAGMLPVMDFPTPLLMQSAMAQTNSNLPNATQDVLRSTGNSAADGASAEPDVIGVLIPIDAEGEVSGPYAYVPSRLRKLLSGQDSTMPGVVAPRVLSASYVLRINPASSLSRNAVQELSAEYRVVMDSPGAELRLPFRFSEMPIVRSEINGQADLLGETSIRQELEAITFRSQQPGTYLLKIVFAPPSRLANSNSAIGPVNANSTTTGLGSGASGNAGQGPNGDTTSARNGLDVRIPRVPSAEMRVIHDANTNVELSSRGRQQRSPGEISADLGPVDRLVCRWESKEINSAQRRGASTSSELWVKASGERLTAAARLVIENPADLPEQFHLVIDQDWEPVGSAWGDVELVASSSMAFSSRRIYTVRLSRDLQGRSRALASLFLTPRPSASVSTGALLTLPFVTLQEAGQSSERTFYWTADLDASWSLDGLRSWPKLPRASMENWGDLQLADAAESYRVPLGTLSTGLRSELVPEVAPVSEFNDVHVSDDAVSIEYHAGWAVPVERRAALRFEIPGDARVRSVLVDGAAWDFQQATRGDRRLLLVSRSNVAVDLDARSVQSVDIQVSYGIPVNTPVRLQRIVMLDTDATSSVLRLMCGAGLQCELAPAAAGKEGSATRSNPVGEVAESDSSGDMEFQFVPARPTEMLERLQSVVGQAELGNALRQTSVLPFEFRVSQRPEPRKVSATMYFEQDEQGWLARLETQWISAIARPNHSPNHSPDREQAESGEASAIDFAFFDLPTSLRDAVEAGSLPRRMMPTGAANRTTLCLIPPPPVAGRTNVSLTFRLDTATSLQALAIPDVRVLGAKPIRPAVALPMEIESEPVQWSGGGRPVGPQWQDDLSDRLADNGSPKYQYFLHDENQRQATWEVLQRTRQSARLLMSKLTIATLNSREITGFVDYWVDPRGQLSLPIKIQPNVSVIGVLSGGHPAHWQRPEGSDRVNVLLQPNYLPVNLRLLLAWKIADDQTNGVATDKNKAQAEWGSVSLTLPSVVQGNEADVSNVAPVRMLVQLPDTQWEAANSDARAISKDSVLEAWSAAVLTGSRLAGGLNDPERRAWLQSWSPNRLGIETSASLPGTLSDSTGAARSVGEFWTSMCEQMQLPAALGFDGGNAGGPNVDSSGEVGVFEPQAWLSESLVQIESSELQLYRIMPRDSWTSRVAAAMSLALIALALAYLGGKARSRYFELLAAQPWLYWLQLSVLAWLFLPAEWPSWVLAFTAAAMLLGQFVDYRRAVQFR